MANWCENRAYIVAPSEEEAQLLVRAVRFETMMEDFDDLPDDGDIGGPGLHAADLDGTLVDLLFHTRWIPPIGLYDYLVAKGWKVNAVYCEPGEEIWGEYEEGTHVEKHGPVETAARDVLAELDLLWMLEIV